MKDTKPIILLTAGLLGTILEWYDFSVYVYLAPILSAIFFPNESKYISLMLSFLVFAIGYLLRPLGGAIFGHFGDRYGRRITFIASILLMSTSTCLIGFLPTHSQAGVIAPLLLILLRLLQGLSVGGELIGTLTLFFELAPMKKRGVNTALMWIGSGGGILMSSIVVAILTRVLSQQQLHDWGWRIPFFLGALTGLIGFFLRNRTRESVSFLSLKTTGRVASFPFHEILKFHKVKLFKLFLIFIPSAVSFYLVFVFMPTYTSSFLKMSMGTTTTINTVNLFLLLVFSPLVGLLSDKIGRKIVLLSGLAGFIIASMPLYILISKASVTALFFSQFMLMLLCSLYLGGLMAFALEIIPTYVRYSIAAIGFNLCYSIFGGTTPLIATFLINKSGNVLGPAYYLIFSAIVALPVFLLSKEQSLESTEQVAADVN